MEQITDFKQLIEGKIYNIYCKPFDITNECYFVGGDTTELNRPITYWQFMNRGGNAVNIQQLRLMFNRNYCPKNLFALWDHDLKNNIITPVN